MKRWLLALGLTISAIAFARQSGDRPFCSNPNEDKDCYMSVTRGGSKVDIQFGTLFDDYQSIGSVGSASNAQGALVDSLFPTLANVRYFHLDNDDGATILDDSGNASDNLTKAGSPAFDALGFFERSVYRMTSASDSLGNTSGSIYQTGPADDFAYGGWLRLATDLTPSSIVLLFQNSDATTGGSQVILDTDGTIKARLIDSAGSLAANLTWAADEVAQFQDEWVHIVFWHDQANSEFNLYINGQPLVAAGDSTYDLVNTPVFRIAAGSSGGPGVEYQDVFFVNGDLLTNAEVNAIYSRRFTNSQQRKGGHVLTSDSFLPSDLTDRISFWNLNADASDDSVNSQDFTVGSVTFNGLNIFGSAGAAELASGKQLVNPDDPFFDAANTGDMSFGGWFNVADWNPTPAGNKDLVAKFVTNVGSSAWDLFLVGNNSDAISFGINADGDNSYEEIFNIDSSSLRNGTWHHIALVYVNAEKVEIYYDGILVHTEPTTAVPIDSAADLTIGGFDGSSTTRVPDMSVEQFFFANFALSQAEIKRLASSRIDHNKSISSLTGWQVLIKEDLGSESNPLILPYSGVLDSRVNSLYGYWLDQETGDEIQLKLQ